MQGVARRDQLRVRGVHPIPWGRARPDLILNVFLPVGPCVEAKIGSDHVPMGLP